MPRRPSENAVDKYATNGPRLEPLTDIDLFVERSQETVEFAGTDAPKWLQIISFNPEVHWNVVFNDGAYHFRGLVAAMGPEGPDLSHTLFSKLLTHIDGTSIKALEMATGLPAKALWDAQLHGLYPQPEGMTKAEWIAGVWRYVYEPSGRTLRDLAGHLELGWNSVRNYASENDPAKCEPSKASKGAKNG